MGWFNAILPFLGTLVESLSKLFLGLFLVNTGKEKEKLAAYEEQDKNIATSKDIKAKIDSVSDEDLRKMLENEK